MAKPDKKRSVLIVGPVAPVDGGKATGGVAQHTSDLARALDAVGWRVTVYADDLAPGDGRGREMAWGTLYGPVAPKRVAWASLSVKGGASSFARAYYDRHRAAALRLKTRSVIAHAVGLRIAAERSRPDVVHYQHADLRPYWGTLADLTGPMVVTAHSLSAFRDFDNPVLHQVTEDALRRADVVLAVSADTADELAARLPGLEPVVVGNGIDLSTFGSAKRPPGDVAGRVVLYQGRVAAQKGIRELVAAMAVVRARVPDAMLVVAGAEEDVSVAELAAEAGLDPAGVVTTGYLSADQVASWLHRADVVALPSIVREGQPRSVMEAMAAGRAIVASRIGGLPDLLGEGDFGVLVEPGDSAALADALVGLLNDPARAAALGARARKAAARFDTRAVAKKVAKAYQAAIEAHAG